VHLHYKNAKESSEPLDMIRSGDIAIEITDEGRSYQLIDLRE